MNLWPTFRPLVYVTAVAVVIGLWGSSAAGYTPTRGMVLVFLLAFAIALWTDRTHGE